MLGEVILKAVIILVFVVPLVAGCLTLYIGAVWMKMQEERRAEPLATPDGAYVTAVSKGGESAVGASSGFTQVEDDELPF